MRNGSRVARKFKKGTEREFERGVTPSAQQAAELAARYCTASPLKPAVTLYADTTMGKLSEELVLGEDAHRS